MYLKNKIKRVVLLGATGKVGTLALSLFASQAASLGYQLVGLTANTQGEALLASAELCPEFIELLALTASDSELIKETVPFSSGLPKHRGSNKLHFGWSPVEAFLKAGNYEVLLVACSGIEALPSVIEALLQGKEVWIANKEIIVSAYPFILEAQKRGGGRVYPLDSEHQAIYHCLPEAAKNAFPIERSIREFGVAKCFLFASGGPFWGKNLKEASPITPEQALAHPVWRMGKKISVDSATMMNKGLEYIEARYLFHLEENEIEVIYHPQAEVHGAIEDLQGRQLFQAYPPSMKYGLAQVMAYPASCSEAGLFHPDEKVKPLTASLWKQWVFETIEIDKVPALSCAREAYRKGAGACCWLDAANQTAVEAFLKGSLPFHEIVPLCLEVLRKAPQKALQTVREVQAFHKEGKDFSKALLA